MGEIKTEMSNLIILGVIILAVGAVIRMIIAALKPSVKGKTGEMTISFLLRKLPSNEYCILNDILLQGKYGTSQIDHIIVSIYGLFVIETKNYKGVISGNDQSEMWRQYTSGRNNTLKNPVKQNYGHIKTLQEHLQLEKTIPFVSIVAFPGDCKLKATSKEHVIYWGNIKKTIKSYDQVVMTPN